jgi:DNA mismatch repair protein MutL
MPSAGRADVPIRILSEDVASAIAAGEVIERPASVVKELIENALDAGARSVQLRIEAGGRGLVEVGDDGGGIAAAEIPLALARHATSKLRTTDDLFAIRTLGFRGEALASIAAVAHLELVSRAAGEPGGTRLAADGGVIGQPGAIGAALGTVVRVRDLFFNMPARKKFLKGEETERRRILALVTRYALAYPHVRFTLIQEGRQAFASTGGGDRREVLAAVFGLDVARALVGLPPTEGRSIRVEGFISPPSVHRSNRREVTLFVNGRWIQDAALAAAVVQAYHGLLMVGRYPIAALFVSLAPEDVDVNVHPAKAEVRFRDPEAVFATVQRAVRATLLGLAPVPGSDGPVAWGAAWQPGVGTLGPDPAWAIAHAPLTEPAPLSPGTLPATALPLLRNVGQVGATYLVAEGPDGLYLIDQHAAHERVLFEKLLQQQGTGGAGSQALLEPVTVELAAAEAALLQGQLEVLRRLGFEVEDFGRNAFRVRAVPPLLAALPPANALRAVIEDFEEDEAPLADVVEARVAARVCKRAAVKAGQVLSLVEQEHLLRDLEACALPRTCPHGRPTMIHLSVDSLERQFGRRG